MKKEERVHFESLVIDAHADTAVLLLKDRKNLHSRSETGHIDLPRLKEGGVNVQVFAVYIPHNEKGHLREALEMIDALKREITASGKENNRESATGTPEIEAALVTTSGELEETVRQGKIAAIIGIEGGHIIEDSLAVLRALHELGARYLTLTWNNNNNWADGCGAQQKIPNHGGLTPFGRQVVEEMNRIGMLVDLAHAADQTIDHVLAISEKPVIVSHTCMHSLNPLSRNLKDHHARAIAEKGGVIGINFFPSFLDADFRKAYLSARGKMEKETRMLRSRFPEEGEEFERLRRELEKGTFASLPPVSYHRILDHIDHAVQIAGIDHVGLGSDFDGVPCLPGGLEDCSKLPKLTSGLWKRGYREKAIKKILGENYLRVFKQIF